MILILLIILKIFNTDYQKEFRDIGIKLGGNLSIEEWEDLFRKITFWELELEKSGDDSMKQILEMQKSEANAQFFKFIKSNYESWFSGSQDSPLMSHQIFKHSVLPELNEDKTTFFIVIDNPSKIDSPIKKWPILNSCIPFTLDNILAEVYVKPCPA